MVGVETPSCHGSGPPPLNERPPDVASDSAITVDLRPALELVRRILASPTGVDHANHILAMIADGNLLEVISGRDGADLRAVPSLELMRVADAAGVERVA